MLRPTHLAAALALTLIVGACAAPAAVTPTNSPAPTVALAVTSTPTAVASATPPPSLSPTIVAERTNPPSSRAQQTQRSTAPPVTPPPTPSETPTVVWPSGAISSYEASAHAGKRRTVCGEVVTPNYSSGGTFLNLDEPYPRHIFTILIWEEDRERYPELPEEMFAGQSVCVTGTIEPYRGVHQIVARKNTVRLATEN
jgi:hypothetical protein